MAQSLCQGFRVWGLEGLGVIRRFLQGLREAQCCSVGSQSLATVLFHTHHSTSERQPQLPDRVEILRISEAIAAATLETPPARPPGSIVLVLHMHYTTTQSEHVRQQDAHRNTAMLARLAHQFDARKALLAHMLLDLGQHAWKCFVLSSAVNNRRVQPRMLTKAEAPRVPQKLAVHP